MPEVKPAITIKKYANRRLYDTEKSTYVTLEDLCQLVKEGVEFKVIDAKTNEDLTRSTLTQIIFEQESKGYNLLPINFLRHIIKFYDDSLSAVLPDYLDKTMQSFMDNQDRMRSYMDSFSTFAPFQGLQGLDQMRKRNLEIFEKTMSMWNPFAGGVSGEDKGKKG